MGKQNRSGGRRRAKARASLKRVVATLRERANVIRQATKRSPDGVHVTQTLSAMESEEDLRSWIIGIDEQARRAQDLAREVGLTDVDDLIAEAEDLRAGLRQDHPNIFRHSLAIGDTPPGVCCSPAVEQGSLEVQAQWVRENPGTQSILATLGSLAIPSGWVENQPSPPLPQGVREFFHFTSHYHLPAVLRHGLAKGDVAITPGGGFCAPWLTEDAGWDNQTWVIPPTPPTNIDKNEVRLTVWVPSNDPCLWHWPRLAREEGMDETWYRTLNTLGAPHRPLMNGTGARVDNSRYWYLYKGRIPVEWVQAVDFRDSMGTMGMGKTMPNQLT